MVITVVRSELSEQDYWPFVLRRALRLFIPLAFFTISAVIAFHYFEVDNQQIKIQSHATASASSSARALDRSLRSAFNDLTYLADHKGFKDLYRTGSAVDEPLRLHIRDDWLAFSRAKRVYDQIRWISADGQELVRINFNRGNPFSVPDYELQNKAGRYYFRETFNLNPGQIYLSRFDLNIEHGVIEQPIKPMIRIGTPLFDQAGHHQGIVLLNYLGDQLLEEFSQAGTDERARTWLVNADGYWLKGPSPRLEWGFMYEQDASLARSYPRAWERIASADRGQFEDGAGLWSFATVYPLNHAQNSGSTYNRSLNAAEAKPPMDQALQWKTVVLIPSENYRAFARTQRLILTVVVLLLLALFLFGSLRHARSLFEKQLAEQEVLRVNEGLEQIVAERTQALQQAKMQAEQLARTDPLTGLNNHRAFFEHGARVEQYSKRYEHPYSLIMIDLDHFKQINDSHGHHVGDDVLIAVGGLIKDLIRDSDVVGRIGGEEFALILPDSDLASARGLAERLRLQIAALKIPLDRGWLTVTASFGVAEFQPRDVSLSILMQRADDALYQAKANGRNRVELGEV